MLLNELGVVTDAASYSFNMPPAVLLSPPQPLEDISIEITGVKKAVYLVRLQVDNANSPLNRNVAGEFITPQLDLS